MNTPCLLRSETMSLAFVLLPHFYIMHVPLVVLCSSGKFSANIICLFRGSCRSYFTVLLVLLARFCTQGIVHAKGCFVFIFNPIVEICLE